MIPKLVVIFIFSFSSVAMAEIKRYPLSDYPQVRIAEAVEVPAGSTTIYYSGAVPSPADPSAAFSSRTYWGRDTEIQANSIFSHMQASLADKGLNLGDVVKMTVFLVGVPELKGRLDMAGFTRAYNKYFGTKEQPNLPARSTVQVAALAVPGLLVEVEFILSKQRISDQ